MDTITSYLREQEEAFLQDLAALVSLDCGTYNKAGVDAVGTIMARLLESAGFEIERIPLADYGDCLCGRIGGRGQARIMLVGHLDTVYPDGTAAARPFRIEEGRVIGPGTCDMKGGLLAGLYAVRALQAVGFDDFAEIVFFLNSEEEVGSPRSRMLYADLARAADVALVLEAARVSGAIVSMRKGSGTYTLRVGGISAHAGAAPERGANAIVELAHQIQAIQALTGMRPGLTTNVGVVRGGMRPNVVPDLAEAEIDFRVERDTDFAALDEAIRQLVAVSHVPGTTITLSGGIDMPPMAKTRATDMLAGLARSVAASLGFDLDDIATGGASDANHIAALGTPVLDGLGPIGHLAHSPNEYLDRRSIVPRTALLAGLISAIVRDRAAISALRG